MTVEPCRSLQITSAFDSFQAPLPCRFTFSYLPKVLGKLEYCWMPSNHAQKDPRNDAGGWVHEETHQRRNNHDGKMRLPDSQTLKTSRNIKA